MPHRGGLIMSNPVESLVQPAHEFQTRFGAPPDVQKPEAEVERWMQMCKELLEERDRLRAERDELRRAVLALTREEIPFTREEVFASIGQKPTIRELIEELEREARS